MEGLILESYGISEKLLLGHFQSKKAIFQITDLQTLCMTLYENRKKTLHVNET